MPYAGRALMARDIVALCRDAGWRQGDLVKMVATCLGESNGYTAAWNENLSGTGTVFSKDVGLFQINIPPIKFGSTYEAALCEPAFNVGRARDLFLTRKFQPWVAYRSGWVMFPEHWVWKQTNGVPTGPWVPTGRFIHRALRGWVNSLVLHLDHKVEVAIYHGDLRAREYGIDGRFVPGAKPSAAPIDWADVPAKPVAPPADGVGPRPVKNDGSK